MSSLVSVIMPTYNQNNLLHKAVESVINQTYRDFELIVIDDNKNNKLQKNNKEYFDNLHDSRIIYLQNEMNYGSAKSRNKGISLAKGEYITFLDDDDCYELLKVEKQVDFMQNSDYDVSVCNLIIKNEKGKVIDKRRRNYFSQNEPLLNLHLKYHITGTDTMMFKADFLKRIGGFGDKDLGDEFYLMLNAIENGAKVGHLNYDGVSAILHRTTGLSSADNKIKTEKEVFDLKKKYFYKLKKKDIRFIKMRHYAVLAVACKKRKKTFRCFGILLKAFFFSPRGFFKLYSGDCR